jgi:hypothetical protein
MSESLLTRAAVSERPDDIAPVAHVENAADTPRGVALRRTSPRRVMAEAAAPRTDEMGAALAALAADRPTPAPRAGGWRMLFGGAR